MPVETPEVSIPVSSTSTREKGAGRKRWAEPYRVLHVINGEHFSGAERVQDLLALRLPLQGFDVGFACLKPDKFPVSRVSKTPLYELPMSSRFDLKVVRELVRIVRHEGYQLIHAHTPRSVLIGRAVATLARVPMVYHVHSPTARDSTRAWQNRLNHWIERISLTGVKALIPVSHSLREHMVAKGYRESIVFPVPNGVPTPTTMRDDTLPKPPWRIGTVALFRPRKGLEVLIEALAILKNMNVPVRLRAVGPFETADYHRSIEKQVNDLELSELFDWGGFTKNVSDELSRMDLLVLPSLFGEGLPMVVLEAMAAGVPVVASRVEGVPEAIEDGVNGLLVAPNQPQHLANAIARVVQGEVSWSGLRNRARQQHAQRFSDEAMAAGVARVYRKILG